MHGIPIPSNFPKLNMKAPQYLSVLAIVAAALSAGCAGDDGPLDSNPNPGTIAGRVADVMGRPVNGVRVATTPSTAGAVSGPDGTFLIADVDAGSYVVSFSRSGFDSALVSATVTEGQSVTLASTIKDAGMVAAWPFAGSTADAAGGGHDGLASGATLSRDRFGTDNMAYQFDGNDFIMVAHDNDLVFSESDFTVSAWVMLDGPQDDYAGIVSKCTPASPEYGYQLVIRQPTNFGMQIGSRVPIGRSYFESVAATSLSPGSWAFVTMVVSRDIETVQLYVNGVLRSNEVSDKLSYSLAEDEPLYIGRERQALRWFKGSIDDIRIFSRALTGSEVAELSTR